MLMASLRVPFFVVCVDAKHLHPFAVVEVALTVSEGTFQELVNLPTQ